MLTYSFADLQGESMYAHLYKCIKNDITNGVLHAEEKLPSKRMLAKNLGISSSPWKMPTPSSLSKATSIRSPSAVTTWRALSSSLCR